MPIVDGEYVPSYTAAQLDELFFNINFGSVNYRALQPTPTLLFSSRTVTASGTATSSGLATGNNAKMSVTFSQTGLSTNCTMELYKSDHSDLSSASVIATLTLGAGEEPVSTAIEPSWIPAYTFCKLINNDSTNSAIATVEVMTWQEPAT